MTMDYSSLSPTLQVSAPALACAGMSFVFIFFLYTKIWTYKTGTDIGVPAIDTLAAQIKSGARSFLATEYVGLR